MQIPHLLKRLTLIGGVFLLISTSTLAYTGDLSVTSQNIQFSSDYILQNHTIRIYATVTNNSNQDLLGVVRFYDNGSQISGDQAISVFKGSTDGVFIDWTPRAPGEHTVKVQLYPWQGEIDNPGNNVISATRYVVPDADGDGIPNDEDPDMDGDNVDNEQDAFPLNSQEQFDTDGDGIGNNADEDDDGDEVPDSADDLPLDPEETTDTDGDGIGNVADTDDDNDNLSDAEEENKKTNPLNPDTDADGVNAVSYTHLTLPNAEDDFPLDPEEQFDTDKDGIGNSMDPDDDNDGIKDIEDPYPLNKSPQIKLSSEDLEIGLLEKTVFDASPSTDDDGEILSYLWQINDLPEQEGNAITHIFDKKGDHSVTLSIIDDNGEEVTKNFQISVTNLRLQRQLIFSFLAILLAIIIFLYYIRPANSQK